MTNKTPVPDLIRYPLGGGSIGADHDSLFLGGEERYAEEGTREVRITDENRSEVAAVLRELADFVEGKGAGAPSGVSAKEPTKQIVDEGPLDEERQV
jgi:hypothetical protein